MSNDRKVLEIKSRFFDLLEIDSERFQFNKIYLEMVRIIGNIVGFYEVTFYINNEWEGQFQCKASTSSRGESEFSPISCEEFEKLIDNEMIVYSPIDHPLFQSYDLLIPLKKGDRKLGFIKMKGTKDLPDSDELLNRISSECSEFIYKLDSLSRIIVKENRYKQLFRVTEKFHSSMDMDAVLGEIIFTLKEVYPNFTYHLLLSHDNPNHGHLPIKDLEYDSEDCSAMQAFVSGTIQIEDSVREKRTVLYAPLKGKQGVYGVLEIAATNTTMFPNSEVEFITLLANTAGSAIENAQLYQQSRKLISDLQLINETSHRLNSNLRLSETVKYMTERIKHSFGAEEVGFIFGDHQFNKIEILYESTPFFSTDESKLYLNYICKKLKKEKDSLFIGDLTFDGEEEAIYKSIMVVPMEQTGVVKGFCIAMHREPYFFTFDTFKLLQSLIHHSTLAFTNSILREELEKMVITDYLTSLYTRSYLDDKIQRSLQEDGQGVFILMDIDDFKLINDTYGHQVGDEILVQVASVIKSNIRETDIGARWGGEELAVYLPRVSLEIGEKIAQRLVNNIRQHTDPKVTVSCGVSHWQKEYGDTYTTLFKRADKALYKAKTSGKNQVVIQSVEDLPQSK